MPEPAPRLRRILVLLAYALPLVAAAWLRGRHPGGLEPFVDEGADILTALDPRVRAAFEPLEQGRPLLIWLYAPAGLFPADILLAGRLMAASAGLLTAGALGWTLHRLAGRAAALWGLWLWALLPLAVWHERLALQDPFVTAALALATAALVGAQDGPRRHAWWAASGLMFGSAFLLKISALFAGPWLALLYLALRREQGRTLMDLRLFWFGLGALAPVLALGDKLPLLGSKLAKYHALPCTGESAGGSGILDRLQHWVGWYTGYGGWPLLLLLALAVLLLGRLPRRRLTAVCLAGGWGVTLLVSGLLFNNGYARYALPDHLPLVLFLALVMGTALATVWWRIVVPAGLAVLIRWAVVDWQIGTEPSTAPVPAADIAQYVTGPWSGRGTAEVLRYLDDYADRHQVQCLVLTHRALRPGCYALMLAERGDARIGVVPQTVYEPAELDALRPGLRHVSAGRQVAFFLLYEGSLYPAPAWLERSGTGIRLAHTVDRGAGESFRLYQFEP